MPLMPHSSVFSQLCHSTALRLGQSLNSAAVSLSGNEEPFINGT